MMVGKAILGEDAAAEQHRWLFSQATRENGLNLCQGMFRLDLREYFFPERVARHWHRLCRAEAESPSLQVFVKGDEALPSLV